MSYLLSDDALQKQCYEAAIEACSRARKWECAMDIFREAEGKFDKDRAALKPMFRSVLLAVRQETSIGNITGGANVVRRAFRAHDGPENHVSPYAFKPYSLHRFLE